NGSQLPNNPTLDTSASTPAESTELNRRLAKVVPGGVNSNVRLAAPRLVFTGGSGARLTDVDGRDYIDYVLGQGPAFLGHGHEVVNAAVAKAARGGIVFGAQTPVELRASELLVGSLGWPERVRFGVSGTESVQAGLRVARAATGRN